MSSLQAMMTFGNDLTRISFITRSFPEYSGKTMTVIVEGNSPICLLHRSMTIYGDHVETPLPYSMEYTVHAQYYTWF